MRDKTTITRNLQQEFAEGKITMKEALKQPQWWDEAPKDTEYAAGEAGGQKVAARMGIPGAGFQEKLWVGAGDVTGLGSPGEPILTTLGRRIAYTAYQMGTTPEKVLSALVRGKIPLLEIGGAVGLGLPTLGALSGTQSEDDARRTSRY